MNKALVEMFQYIAWANQTLFAACGTLTEEQLDIRIAGVSGAVVGE